MDVTIKDFSVLLYNFAVVLSGGFAVMQIGIDDRAFLLVLSFIFAVFWSVYFRLRMMPRLTADESEDEDDEGVVTGPQ